MATDIDHPVPYRFLAPPVLKVTVGGVSLQNWKGPSKRREEEETPTVVFEEAVGDTCSCFRAGVGSDEGERRNLQSAQEPRDVPLP